ncbi:MAG: uracil-DNA glycosylase [Mariprofundales bacterium]|nr:uracil-DNA glycosylase [Mariprofundales bacterium]
MADDALLYYLEAVGCDSVTAAAILASSSDEEGCGVVDSVRGEEPVVESGDDGAAAWAELALEVAGCDACALSAGRGKPVFGSGAVNADLLLIGEAPDGDEDRQGRAFVGRAGRLLEQMLAAIELDREQVQVINVVKCHPPQNRSVKPQELAACRHFIEAQIAIVQPKVIGLLGSVAACAMLGRDAPLSVSRHCWHTVQGTPAYVTYHPAFLLRSQRQKVEGWHDLLQIKQRLRSLSAS